MSDEQNRNPRHKLRDDFLEVLKLLEAIMPPSIRGAYQIAVESLREGLVSLTELDEYEKQQRKNK